MALIVSAALGIEILLTDSELWESAPEHAYGLIGFVIVDFSIAGSIFVKKRLAYRLAIVWAIVQFSLMLGDITTARTVGFDSYNQFVEYLFSLWNFDLLLITQPVIAFLGYKVLRSSKRGTIQPIVQPTKE